MAIAIVVLIMVVLVATAAYDARARRKGRRLRSSGDMIRSERDVQRNVRASGATIGKIIDKDWSKPDDQRRFRRD